MTRKTRAKAGDNNPPPEAIFAIHIDELFSLLSDTLAGGKVDDDAKEAAIDALMDDFRKAERDADEQRATIKKPHWDAAKAVDAAWKPIIQKATRGVTACKDALTPYRIAKQRELEKAAEKARKEAEAKQRAAQKAIRQSDDLEAKFQAEQQFEQAQKLVAQANRIERTSTGLRTTWEAEITDRKEALRFYLAKYPEAFVELIQSLADRDARGARPKVPGIIYHERKKAA